LVFPLFRLVCSGLLKTTDIVYFMIKIMQLNINNSMTWNVREFGRFDLITGRYTRKLRTSF